MVLYNKIDFLYLLRKGNTNDPVAISNYDRELLVSVWIAFKS